LAVLPLDDAVRILDLDPQHLLRGSQPSKFGDIEFDVARVGYGHMLVEVGEDEAQADWPAGYYRSSLAAAEAFFRLQVHQELGNWWRDEWIKDRDADGEPAVWLRAVLKPDAPDAEWARENRERIRTAVRAAATQSGVSDWIFIRFRNEREERAAS
jgi:hypothetical protein